MERSAGIMVVAVGAVLLMVAALSTQGGAVQVSALAPNQVASGDGSHGHGGQAFSTGALHRAVLDQEWHKSMQERCFASSPFAASALRPQPC